MLIIQNRGDEIKMKPSDIFKSKKWSGGEFVFVTDNNKVDITTDGFTKLLGIVYPADGITGHKYEAQVNKTMVNVIQGGLIGYTDIFEIDNKSKRGGSPGTTFDWNILYGENLYVSENGKFTPEQETPDNFTVGTLLAGPDAIDISAGEFKQNRLTTGNYACGIINHLFNNNINKKFIRFALKF